MSTAMVNDSIKQDRNAVIIPMNLVHEDVDFNCRGKITAIDVDDLIQSIREVGLQQPVIIREYNEERQAATGYKYGLVAGYRRFYAMKALKKDVIPAKIAYGMSDNEARVINLQENVIRKNLDILQEAKAMEKLKAVGFDRKEIARKLHVSTGWVQMREMVLNFPEDIQIECGKGNIGQQHIKALATLKNDREKLYEEVRRLKSAKIRGEKNIVIKRPVEQNSKRARSRAEINAMFDHLYEHVGAKYEPLLMRVLAWCIGNISSRELFESIKERMTEKGEYYEIPKEELG